MSMVLGRAAIAGDPDAASLSMSTGGVLAFTADIDAVDVNECKARILQLSGLVDNPDEPVVPFTWTEDPSFDGFYRVESLTVTPFPVYLATGGCSFSVSMRKVGGFGRPQFESITQNLVRTNVHGVTAPVGIYSAVPVTQVAGGIGYVDRDFPDGGAQATEDGTFDLSVNTDVAPIAVTSRRWAVPASRYYSSSCKIEVKYGSTWYPIHGAQVPSATGLDWRITNGNVRMTPGATGTGYFTIETYLSGSWTGKNFMMANLISSLYNPFETITGAPSPLRVVRNTPECVIARVRPFFSAGGTTDFSIRRGDTHVEISIAQTNNQVLMKHGVGCFNTTASTVMVGGIRATANDVNGKRFWIASPAAHTTDLLNGILANSAFFATGQFAVSCDYLGQFIDTPTGQRDRFFNARQERIQVVSR